MIDVTLSLLVINYYTFNNPNDDRTYNCSCMPCHHDLLAQLYPSFAKGAPPFFTLNWSKYAEFLTFHGRLDLLTKGLWLTNITHHYLAIAIFFLIAGHFW